MSNEKRQLTPQERLELATRINELLEQHFPSHAFEGHEEAIILLLGARTAGLNRRYSKIFVPE